MARERGEDTLGRQLRRARLERGLSLHQLARLIGKTPSYLSDIELNRRVPAEGVMADLARELGLDLDRLMAMAGRLGEAAEQYLARHPAAITLIRRLAQANLSEDQLEQVMRDLERFPQQS